MELKSLKILALIPARGGSKGIPRKNIIDICGKPLIYWTIQLAKRSKYINRVIVSTDSSEIAEISKLHGAEIPFIRPDEISQDNSTDLEVFKHSLSWLEKKDKYTPDLVVHLRPTGPARYINIIDDAIEKLSKDLSFDCLRSVSLSSQTAYKMWQIENSELISIGNKLGVIESHSAPRQALPKTYWQNGYVDIVRPKTIFKQESMTGKKVMPFLTIHKSNDLDYPEDIKKVEKDLKEVIKNDFLNTSLQEEDDRFPV